MRVVRLTKDEWFALSADAHLIAFNKKIYPADERIDFALLVESESGVPMGYVTCREFDVESLYWQYGGSFPGTKDTTSSWRVYQALARWCSERYARVFTYIENTNTVMLKMAMKVGYRICGIRNYKSYVLVEHLLEF